MENSGDTWSRSWLQKLPSSLTPGRLGPHGAACWWHPDRGCPGSCPFWATDLPLQGRTGAPPYPARPPQRLGDTDSLHCEFRLPGRTSVWNLGRAHAFPHSSPYQSRDPTPATCVPDPSCPPRPGAGPWHPLRASPCVSKMLSPPRGPRTLWTLGRDVSVGKPRRVCTRAPANNIRCHFKKMG